MDLLEKFDRERSTIVVNGRLLYEGRLNRSSSKAQRVYPIYGSTNGCCYFDEQKNQKQLSTSEVEARIKAILTSNESSYTIRGVDNTQLDPEREQFTKTVFFNTQGYKYFLGLGNSFLNKQLTDADKALLQQYNKIYIENYEKIFKVLLNSRLNKTSLAVKGHLDGGLYYAIFVGTHHIPSPLSFVLNSWFLAPFKEIDPKFGIPYLEELLPREGDENKSYAGLSLSCVSAADFADIVNATNRAANNGEYTFAIIPEMRQYQIMEMICQGLIVTLSNGFQQIERPVYDGRNITRDAQKSINKMALWSAMQQWHAQYSEVK